METINIRTNSREELLDITAEVEAMVKKSKIREGLAVVFCPHTTAGLTINENADPSVRGDIEDCLGRLVPQSRSYQHQEGNSGAHIKGSLLGFSLNLIIAQGRLVLGTWQGIYFCEFDGPRQRKVFVKLISEQ